LELNEKDKDGFYPLFSAVGNIEMIKLLMEYAEQH